MLQILIESLEVELEKLLRMAPRVAFALAVFVASIFLGRLLARLVGTLLERGRLSSPQKSFFRRLTVWAVALLGLAVALNLVGLRTAASGLLAGGGITAVVLGFAFREIGENFLAGFLLAFSRPFKLGDIIQSGEFKGTVRGIEMRHTHLRTSDGRDVFVPNAEIINRPLVNYTRDGLLRPAFTLGIDYADDARDACRLLSEAVSSVPGVVAEPRASAGIAGLDSSWVQIEVSFWIDTFQKGVSLAAVKTAAMDACRRALLDSGFTVSSEVSTNLVLRASAGTDVRLSGGAGREVT